MSEKTVFEVAEGFVLTIERVVIPDDEKAFKIYKGINPIFVGTEEAVRKIPLRLREHRPGLFEGSMIGYKE